MGTDPVSTHGNIQDTAGSQPKSDPHWQQGVAKSGGSVSPANEFNDYADLFNGFQDLAAAAVNQQGKGLQTYRLGRDLSAGHRDLLNDVRKVLIAGQSASPEARQSAAADWRRLSKKLKKSLDDARKLKISGAVIAAVTDDIAMIGERYLNIPVKGPSEVESSEDYAETLFAVRSLLYEFDRMGEGSLGLQRESVQGRPDAAISMATHDLNAQQREKIQAVKLGEHMLERHRALVEKLREAMLLARSETPGSAYKALTLWNSIKSELAHVMARAPVYVSGNINDAAVRGVTYVNADASELARGLNGFGGALANHYSLVHTETLATALKAPPKAGEAEAGRLAQSVLPKEVQAKLQESRMLGHFRYLLDAVEHGITPIPGRPGEWLLTSGPVQIRLRDDEVAQLRTVVAGQLKDYMKHLVKEMVAAAEDYDSIKRGNSSFKLHLLGGWGGASDPGSQDHYRASVIKVRDTIVFPMIDRGEYLKAFDMILAQKGVVERQSKEVYDYDSDLDVGYSRLARSMQVLEVALTSLVPVAGEAALASEAGIFAVGGTAIASGTVAPVLAEGTRELAFTDEGLQADKLLRTGRHGLAISTGAIAGPASKALGGFAGAAEPGVTGLIGETVATGTVGGTQSLIGGGSFGEGFVGAGVTHLGMRGVTGAGITGPVGTTFGSAGTGAFGAWVSGGDPIAGAAGGVSFVGGAVSNMASRVAQSHEAVPVPVGPEGDAVYHGPAPGDGVLVYVGPEGDAAYRGPAPSDGVPVYVGPEGDAAYRGPAMRALGVGSPPSAARTALNETEWDSRNNRVRGGAFNLHGGRARPFYAKPPKGDRPAGPPAGGGGRDQALSKLGITGEDRIKFDRGEKVWVTGTEGGRRVDISYQFKDGKLTIGALDARDLSKLLNQSPGLAREFHPDTVRLEVNAFPGVLGNKEQHAVQLLRNMGFERDPNDPGLMARETVPNTPERETRAMADSNSPRHFYDSEAKLREGAAKAIEKAIEKAKVKEAADPAEFRRERVRREELFEELGKIDPQLAAEARLYDGAINDPKFLVEQMAYLWKEAAAHGRTTAGELEYILGGGNVYKFDPQQGGKYQEFKDALGDSRPVVDLPFASDFHGSHTHMFHEFLGDRLFGPGAGLSFRLKLANLGWDRWTEVWNVLFDADAQFGSLNSPEVLGEILQTHLDFPRWVRTQP